MLIAIFHFELAPCSVVSCRSSWLTSPGTSFSQRSMLIRVRQYPELQPSSKLLNDHHGQRQETKQDHFNHISGNTPGIYNKYSTKVADVNYINVYYQQIIIYLLIV